MLITCDTCGQEKHESYFYIRQNRNSFSHWKTCMACWASRNKERPTWATVENRGVASWPAEESVIQKLRAIGVFATPGKASLYAHADVVAWGCVKLEVKAATLTGRGRFAFKFSPKRLKEGLRADFVVLILKKADGDTYHVFPANHEVFYRDDGVLADAYYYPNRPMSGRIKDEHLDYYEEAWDQIEERREQIIEEMEFAARRKV